MKDTKFREGQRRRESEEGRSGRGRSGKGEGRREAGRKEGGKEARAEERAECLMTGRAAGFFILERRAFRSEARAGYCGPAAGVKERRRRWKNEWVEREREAHCAVHYETQCRTRFWHVPHGPSRACS